MREIFTYGSVGRAPGNRCLYPEPDTGDRANKLRLLSRPPAQVSAALCGMRNKMGKKNEILLLIDGIINLLLGFVLLLFPFGIAKFIEIPESESSFYPTILGAVIFGIGLSLIK